MNLEKLIISTMLENKIERNIDMELFVEKHLKELSSNPDKYRGYFNDEKLYESVVG